MLLGLVLGLVLGLGLGIGLVVVGGGWLCWLC